MSDLWREPTWTRDPHLDSMRRFTVARSIFIFQRKENPFPPPIRIARPYVNKSGWLSFAVEKEDRPPTTIPRSNPYVDEDAMFTTVLEMPSLDDKYERRQDILWGPGAEKKAACLLIDRAPAMKHEVWARARLVLSETPPHPIHTPYIVTILDRAMLIERRSWQQLETLESAQDHESAAALDIEAVLVSMCSLAGVAARGRDPIEAVGELHYNLSDDMALLRRIHQRLRMLSDAPDTTSAGKPHKHPEASIQEQLDRFKKTWTAIIEQLSPGRLANEMQFYADMMDELVEEDERYAFEDDEQWSELMDIAILREHQFFLPTAMLRREVVKGNVHI
ncbi:hypothetical protein V8C44DRAFT_139721 [Trichoderma aethiopicum]